MNIVRIALVAISTVFSFIAADVVSAQSLGIDVQCSITPDPDVSRSCITTQTNAAIASNPYTTQIEVYNDQYGNTYSATAMARADYGALGASAVGSLLTGIPLGGNTSNLTTSAMSSSTENLIIGGTGTVDIRIVFDIDINSLYADPHGSALASSFIRFATSSPINGLGNSFSELWEVRFYGDEGGSPTQVGTLRVGHNIVGFDVFGIAPGTWDWQSSLITQTVLSANPGGHSASAGAVAFNTVRTYVTVLNPADAQFVTFGSGHDYSVASPVPEPEIYAMLGMGLGFIGWFERRRKQKDARPLK